ncbi:MAG TPA: leucyl aminopeptidase, partial [Alteromonas sp.]|nr:leucyl aminopeptidase [Alteromonas sp.]
VVGVYEPRRLSGVAEQLDAISEGYISNLLRRGDLEGKAGQMLLLHHVPNVLSERVLLVGCGKERELDERQYKQIIAKTIQTLNETGSMEAVCFLTELHVKGRDTYWKVRQAVETSQDTLYTFLQLKTKKGEPRRPLRKIVFNVPTRRELTVGEKAVEHGLAIAKGVKVTKDVANMPPNICNPAYLWEQAQQMAEEYGSVNVEVVNEANMKDLGMNSYLAVGRGSENESLMSIIHHKGGADDQAPLVLVGKGLTFDSGGISLKPGDGMDEMKYDMGGAASVLGVMHTVAALNLPINVIGVLAGCENMPDANAYRPGDILTTMSGQTVEVLNTDAEGRLVLCDALTYVERFDPETVVDVATLTGACIIALGKHATGLMSTHNPLAHELLNASEQASDRAWRLPLWDDYQEQLESPFADMANIGGRPAGSITAGCFLSRFTKKYNWAHLDIAGTAWNSGKNKGATGRPVPMLAQFLMNRAGLGAED